MGMDVKTAYEPVTISENKVYTPDADYGLFYYKSSPTEEIYLDITDNIIRAKNPINYSTGSLNQHSTKRLWIVGNKLYATGTAADSDGILFGSIYHRNVKITDNIVRGVGTALAAGIRVNHLIGVSIMNNDIMDFGIGMKTRNCSGHIYDNRFENVPTLVETTGGNDVGIETPNQGSWNLGDKVEDLTFTSGGTEGWVITGSGTFGTLNSGATTGSITSGTNTLVVNDATGLIIGQYITIAGVTGVFRVDEIDGLTITLDSNADATVVGAAVAFDTATVKTYGSIS